MWIARNKDGFLGLFTDKPFRDKNIGRWCSYTGWYMEITFHYDFDIKWENEPLEVTLMPKNIDEEKLDKTVDDFWNEHAFSEEEYAMVKLVSKEIIRGIQEGYIKFKNA